MLNKLISFLTTKDGKYWAKGDQEETMQAIRQQRTTGANRISDYLKSNAATIGNESTKDMPGSGIRGRIETQRNDLNQRFSDYIGANKAYAGTGGVSDNTRSALQRGPGSIAGKLATPDYSKPYAGYGNIAATGGADLSNATNTYRDVQGGNQDMQSSVDRLKAINFGDVDNAISGISNSISGLGKIDYSGANNSIDRLNEFGATGGVTDADRSNIFRPLYSEFEQTGGYSPTDLANIKKESNAGVSGVYSGLQDELSRSRATSGYSGGFGANAGMLARQGAQAVGDQALKTDIGLSESVRQGKMMGADAIQRGQLGLTSATTGAKEAALSAALQGRLGISKQQADNLVSSGKLSTDSGQLALDKSKQQASNLEASGNMASKIQDLRLRAAQGDVDAQRILQQGKLAGLGGMTDITGAQGQFDLNRANLESGNVSREAGLEQEGQRIGNEGQQFGLSGLGGMYQSELSQLSNEQRNQLQAMGLDADQQNQLLQIMSRTATAPGRNQQLFSNILGGAGAASGGLTGIGNYNRR